MDFYKNLYKDNSVFEMNHKSYELYCSETNLNEIHFSFNGFVGNDISKKYFNRVNRAIKIRKIFNYSSSNSSSTKY